MRDLERETGVGREAIRFYIREGLLPEPERPRRNVAHYSGEHVTRIRAIKRLQEDERLPLSEIRSVLAGADVEALAEGRGAELSRLMGELLGAGAGAEISADAVLGDGLDEAELRRLDALGVIRLRDGDRLDATDARICELWGRARALGFDDGNGFDAPFMQALNTHMQEIARLQVDLFMNKLGREGDGEGTARLAAEGLLLSSGILAAMQQRAVLAVLREAPGEDG